jgi:F0F1-type ATP synthase assembly protein I
MTEEKKPGGGNNARSRQDWLWLSTLGINLVLASAVGAVIGYYLDKLFKTSPIFIIVFFFIGTLAGFLQIYKQVQKMSKDNSNGPQK